MSQSKKPSKEITDWDRRVFQSSHLHSGKYSPSARTLTIQFGDGSEYSHQVPLKVWDSLKEAKSAGSFYSKFITPNFPVTNRITSEKTK